MNCNDARHVRMVSAPIVAGPLGFRRLAPSLMKGLTTFWPRPGEQIARPLSRTSHFPAAALLKKLGWAKEKPASPGSRRGQLGIAPTPEGERR